MSKLIDEKLRLDLVQEYAIFESGRDENLDELAKTAAIICDAKYAFISIVDENVIRFISKFGFSLSEAIRLGSGCDLVIKSKKPLIIDDVSKVKAGMLNDLYTKDLGLLSYAGIPLITKEGVAIGTLSVADRKTMELSSNQILTLETFAKQVIRNLEIKKSNLELQRMQGQFTDIQKICKTGYWELEVATGKVFWTKGVYDIYGVKEDQSFDKDESIDFYAPHERDKISSMVSRSIEEGIEFEDNFEFRDAKGVDKWVRSKGHPVKNDLGEIFKLVGVFQDITSIVNMEESQKFIFETMKVGTFNWDIKKNILIWDDSNYNVFDVKKDDFSGAYEAWESRLDPQWREFATNDLQEALDGKKEFLSTFGIVDSDGVTRYIGARGNIKRDSKGNPIHMIGINWDKTEEYEILQELEKQKKISFHQDKLASLGSLAAGVGHEINNPMAIIKGYCDLLKSQLNKKTLNEDTIDKSLGHIDNAIERVTSIVKGLKNISRQDGQGMDDFDVSELLQESVLAIREIFEKEGIDLSLTTQGNPFILGDRGRIQQVVINLITNAKDAIEKNETKKIEVSLEVSPMASVILKVKDNGSGIPDDIQSKVFDPFFTSKGVNKGTGIGLSLCHQIVSDHEGQISFETNSKTGTIFKIELPLSERRVVRQQDSIDKKRTRVDSTSQEKPSETENNINEQRKKILVVEDEVAIQHILKVLLEDLDFEVVLSGDGKQALEEIENNRDSYDLVLSDIQMPNMNGIELFKRIRDLSGERIPYVLMTGGVSFEDESFASQVDGLIAKPFNSETIKDVLYKALGKNEKSCAS